MSCFSVDVWIWNPMIFINTDLKENNKSGETPSESNIGFICECEEMKTSGSSFP